MMKKNVNKTLVIGFLMLINAALLGSINVAAVDSGGTWIEGINVASFKNGGTILAAYNCEESDILDHLIIDEDYRTFVRMNNLWTHDAYIVIGLAGGYNTLYKVCFKAERRAYTGVGHIKIEIHDINGKWEKIYEKNDVESHQPIQMTITDKVLGKKADMIKIYTFGEDIMNTDKWFGYEIEVYNALYDENPPSVVFLHPDPSDPYVYFNNIKIIPSLSNNIMIGANSFIRAAISDDTIITKWEAFWDGNYLDSQSYNKNDKVSNTMVTISPVIDGLHTYTLKVTDITGKQSQKNIVIHGFTGNSPPFLLSQPQGPSSGYTETYYTYTISATDFDNDNVFIKIDWGDGTNTGWISGNTITKTHKWNNPGTYTITAETKDENGNTGLWTRSKNINIIDQPQAYPPKIGCSTYSIKSTKVKLKMWIIDDGNDDCTCILKLLDNNYNVIKTYYKYGKRQPYSYTTPWITGLSPNTKYYYYAKIINSCGAMQTITKSFTTPNNGSGGQGSGSGTPGGSQNGQQDGSNN